MASGVEVISDGKKTCVKGIKKDVILSAGTFQTPQLLELSGIGNPEVLRKHGIAPVIELPGVGENLRRWCIYASLSYAQKRKEDHICVRSIVEIDAKFETMDVLQEPKELDKHLRLQYVTLFTPFH
jgi:choline dehydrogenase-like flavoprotein